LGGKRRHAAGKCQTNLMGDDVFLDEFLIGNFWKKVGLKSVPMPKAKTFIDGGKIFDRFYLSILNDQEKCYKKKSQFLSHSFGHISARR
jgi:hypothetical protein